MKTAGAAWPTYALIVWRTVRSWPSSATVAARAAASAAAFARASSWARRRWLRASAGGRWGSPAASAARSSPRRTTASQSAAAMSSLSRSHISTSRAYAAAGIGSAGGGRRSGGRALDGELLPALAQVGEKPDDLVDVAGVALQVRLDEVALAEEVDRPQPCGDVAALRHVERDVQLVDDRLAAAQPLEEELMVAVALGGGRLLQEADRAVVQHDHEPLGRCRQDARLRVGSVGAGVIHRAK